MLKMASGKSRMAVAYLQKFVYTWHICYSNSVKFKTYCILCKQFYFVRINAFFKLKNIISINKFKYLLYYSRSRKFKTFLVDLVFLKNGCTKNYKVHSVHNTYIKFQKVRVLLNCTGSNMFVNNISPSLFSRL